MRINISDLWRWEGQIGRRTFVLWGLVLFAIKYNLDRFLMRTVFGRSWSVFSYFGEALPWRDGTASSPGGLFVLLAVALPFLWCGVVLCVKRLRDARLPLWLVVLFVVPIVKWFLFVMLVMAPSGRGDERKMEVRGASRLPKSKVGSAAVAVLIGAVLAVAAVVLSTTVLQAYGWTLFAGVPFAMGFFAAVIYGAGEQRNLRESWSVAMLAVTLTGIVLLAVALEGVMCIVMAAPLAYILASIGATAGHAVQATWRVEQATLCCLPVLAVPLMFGTEAIRPEPPPLSRVVTSVDVDAPIEQVWRHVVEFSELPPPREAMFRCGIAYPIRAEIEGRGPGAVRKCVFSTGSFVEPIEVWNEPRLLKFSVSANPPPMQEWTPFREIHPAHLKGFLVSKQGQFSLTSVTGERTRLEGTTWYQHGLWPAQYWQLWSDRIIHTIHLRVLSHVKAMSEEKSPSPLRSN